MNYDVMCTIFCHPKAKLLVMNLNGMSTKDRVTFLRGIFLALVHLIKKSILI